MDAAKRVPVDWDDLEMALTTNAGDLTCYLDTSTGEVILVPGDGLAEDHDGPSADQLDAWLASGRLLRIEPLESSVEWGWMAEFAASVGDPHLQELLDLALRGRGAFRRFKDALASQPAERERWFAFRNARLRAAAEGWLAEQRIEVESDPGKRV